MHVGFGRRASPRRVPALPRAGVANPCLCSHGACCPFAMQTPTKVKSCSPRGSGFPAPSHPRVSPPRVPINPLPPPFPAPCPCVRVWQPRSVPVRAGGSDGEGCPHLPAWLSLAGRRSHLPPISSNRAPKFSSWCWPRASPGSPLRQPYTASPPRGWLLCATPVPIPPWGTQ